MRIGRLLAGALAVVAAGWLMSACGTKKKSPIIACELEGKVVPTAFTFSSFQGTLALEHGDLEVVTNASLKSRSLEVYFRPLGDGRLLAERVVIIGSVQPGMTPAVLFGLTNVVTAIREDPPRPQRAAPIVVELATNPPAQEAK